MPERIVSLVPAATETLYRLGLGDTVHAVSHACDHPPEAQQAPQATRTRIDPDEPSREIDRAVRSSLEDQAPLYEVHEEVLHHAQPTLVIAQDACNVCGITPVDVNAALARIEPLERPEILTLHPHTFEDVLHDIRRIADAAGHSEAGQTLAHELKARAEAVEDATPAKAPSALVLDWIDPPMVAGHWIPDLLDRAGATPRLTTDQDPSRYVDPQEIIEAAPQHLFVAPCGFDAERAIRETRRSDLLETLDPTPAVQNGRVHALDANAYTSRPGPRLVDGLEQIAHALHPQARIPAQQAERVRPIV